MTESNKKNTITIEESAPSKKEKDVFETPIGESDIVEPWQKQGPEIFECYKKDPNKSYRWLNPVVCDRLGMRGWERDEANAGKTIADRLFLGSMNKKRAEKRKEYFRDINKTQKKIKEERTKNAIEAFKRAQYEAAGRVAPVMSYAK